MSGYFHLTFEEGDRLDLRAGGASFRAIARAPSTISREIGRNALEGGAYRPQVADGAYMLRRQRRARLDTDLRMAAFGWTTEQIAGRLRLGIDRGLGAVCAEPIYGWVYRAGKKTGRLWRYLTRRHARRCKRHDRVSRGRIAKKPKFLSDLTTPTLARRWGNGVRRDRGPSDMRPRIRR